MSTWGTDHLDDIGITTEMDDLGRVPGAGTTRADAIARYIEHRGKDLADGKRSEGDQFALAYALWLSFGDTQLDDALHPTTNSKRSKFRGRPQAYLLPLMGYPMGGDKQARARRSKALSRDAAAMLYAAAEGLTPADVRRELGAQGNGSRDRWSRLAVSQRRSSKKSSLAVQLETVLPVIVTVKIGQASHVWHIDDAPTALACFNGLKKKLNGNPNVRSASQSTVGDDDDE